MHRRRDLADFIQKERAAVRRLEHPEAILHGAREGAAHVSEELAVEQRVRERAAVDGDKRVGPEFGQYRVDVAERALFYTGPDLGTRAFLVDLFVRRDRPHSVPVRRCYRRERSVRNRARTQAIPGDARHQVGNLQT